MIVGAELCTAAEDPSGFRQGATRRDHWQIAVVAPYVGLLVRLGSETKVRLQGREAFRELHPGILVGDRRRDDHVVAVMPVHRGGDAVFTAELEAVERSK